MKPDTNDYFLVILYGIIVIYGVFFLLEPEELNSVNILILMLLIINPFVQESISKIHRYYRKND